MLKAGRILKSNGTEGGILVSFTGVSPEDIDLGEPVFIYDDGLPVPFFFHSLTPRGRSRAIATLTGVRTLKDADELAGRDFFLDADDYGDEETLEGWTLVLEDGTVGGTVADVDDIPGNPCLVVKTLSGKEALVPFREELILSIDKITETIVMSVPADLLSL